MFFAQLSPSRRFLVFVTLPVLYVSIISDLAAALKYGRILSGMAFHSSPIVVCALSCITIKQHTVNVINLFIFVYVFQNNDLNLLLGFTLFIQRDA